MCRNYKLFSNKQKLQSRTQIPFLNYTLSQTQPRGKENTKNLNPKFVRTVSQVTLILLTYTTSSMSVLKGVN
jgi:hypothetical protein